MGQFLNGINDFACGQAACAQSYPQKVCRKPGSGAIAEQKSMPHPAIACFSPQTAACLVFAQGRNSHMNQGDERALRSLRTILSTKAVQNIAALAGSMANSLDCRNAPQNSRMPCFSAMRKIPLESRHFPTVKVLAHILIHKKYAERRDSLFFTTPNEFDATGDGLRRFHGLN